jgi:hypothetical protein
MRTSWFLQSKTLSGSEIDKNTAVQLWNLFNQFFDKEFTDFASFETYLKERGRTLILFQMKRQLIGFFILNKMEKHLENQRFFVIQAVHKTQIHYSLSLFLHLSFSSSFNVFFIRLHLNH